LKGDKRRRGGILLYTISSKIYPSNWGVRFYSPFLAIHFFSIPSHSHLFCGAVLIFDYDAILPQ
jgi:hypothetical protein